MSLTNLNNNIYPLSLDGLTTIDADKIFIDGVDITTLLANYIAKSGTTTNVKATIQIAPTTGLFVIQNSVGAPIFTINNTNITSMYQAFTNILTTPNINAYGNLNLNISNNTLISVVKIIDADGVDLVRTGYFAFGGTFGNKAIQLNSCPLVIEAGITGTCLPETITAPNWSQLRLLNTNVANIFTDICCDGVNTYFITTETASNPITDKPNYSGRTNFYISPDQSTTFQGNINANGDLGVLGIAVFSNEVGFKNNLSFINPADVNINLCEVILTNDYGVDTSKFTFFCGVNLATKWSGVHLPWSNIRMMNGNLDPVETVFNSFFLFNCQAD
jgi:hypothetical protein